MEFQFLYPIACLPGNIFRLNSVNCLLNFVIKILNTHTYSVETIKTKLFKVLLCQAAGIYLATVF